MEMEMGMGALDELEVLAMSPGGSAASATAAAGSEDEADLRRGPWTVEEDLLLVNYIAAHGEGRWNSLARSAGLKRTGKSCRLRWLNYLRPDVRRGNITASEQLLILELHSRWGNRWSKIAQHLPGRTDNEIKNYWRTRVQKHARQLRCDVNSRHFRHVVRHLWIPRLLERIQADAAAGASGGQPAAAPPVVALATTTASGGRLESAADNGAVVTTSKEAHAGGCYDHGDYYYYSYSEPAAADAMSPAEDTSSALRSTVTDGPAQQQHHYCASAATPTNEGCGVVGGAAAGATMEEEDVFAGTWSELLATAGCEDDFPTPIEKVLYATLVQFQFCTFA
ncbi:hypothetical protein HU200_009248 [Digitaria exilis]|uniref:Uncharacterized protein n=1 Tax=Digitaria exilis TaxID=1010633 RepID=A0A835KPP2_9POAL|nr:hypothetical protein HU200_009248 [Digitaria exilis]